MILLLLGTALMIALSILIVQLRPDLIAPIFANLSRMLAAGPGDGRLRELQFELTVFGLIVFVPAMILLWLEVRRTTRDTIRIAQISGSEAHLSTQAVAQSLIYYVDALPGVVRVRPRLSADTRSVMVRLDVETTPDVDVRAKTEEIAQTARNVVEGKLGLKLKKLRIQIHLANLSRGMTPLARPAEQAKPAMPISTGGTPAVVVENKNPLSQ
ncbi:MAG: hypothetical protein ABI874_13645 [Chloroflexota bacterium]